MKLFILKAFIILAPLCVSAPYLSAMNQTATTTTPQRPTVDQINIAMAAAKKGDLKGLAYFVRRYPAFWNYHDTADRSTLTHKAAGHGKLDALQFLLGVDHEGKSLEVRDGNGFTPLERAEEFNRTAVINYLIDFQALHNIPM